MAIISAQMASRVWESKRPIGVAAMLFIAIYGFMDKAGWFGTSYYVHPWAAGICVWVFAIVLIVVLSAIALQIKTRPRFIRCVLLGVAGVCAAYAWIGLLRLFPDGWFGVSNFETQFILCLIGLLLGVAFGWMKRRDTAAQRDRLSLSQ
jgi:hypothetical protein